MGREAINTLAWTLWTNRITEAAEPHMPHPLMAKIVGGTFSGIIAAVLSQPLDTAKVKIQNGLTTGYLHGSILSAISCSYKTQCARDGMIKAAFTISQQIAKEAFLGIGPRAGVLAIFITTVNLSNEHYNKAFTSFLA